MTDQLRPSPGPAHADDGSVTLTPPIGFQQLQMRLADELIKTETRTTARVEHDARKDAAAPDATGAAMALEPRDTAAAPRTAGSILVLATLGFTLGMTAALPGGFSVVGAVALAAFAIAIAVDRDAIAAIRAHHAAVTIAGLIAIGVALAAAMTIEGGTSPCAWTYVLAGAVLTAASYTGRLKTMAPLEARAVGGAMVVLGVYVMPTMAWSF